MEYQYEAATERVSEALETVKYDLMKVRNQDDQLMRQLLNINATIKKLTTRGTKPAKRCSQLFCSCGNRNCGGKRIISASDMRKIDTPLPLQGTLTAFRALSINSTGSGSDYESSDDEINDFSDSDCDVFVDKTSDDENEFDHFVHVIEINVIGIIVDYFCFVTQCWTMEHNGAERVNMAIATLRNDLLEMRNQDVQLMKQLLNINVTIQKMTNERRCQLIKPSTNNHLPKRQQSVPPFMWLHKDYIGSSSCSDDISEEISDYSDTEDDTFSKSNGFPLRNGIVSILPLSDDESDYSSDEEILKTNIKLWKFSRSYDND
ncbi:unnamed protein product [Mytilus coruscus]|uniref:Post-SET domain-containing protein n=1 Tax=Mytilus coruscus TaxID=42192 RepID=A0A6J8ARX3_MYTCO|nr:unnamed protein product [Mytilus coruscus]